MKKEQQKTKTRQQAQKRQESRLFMFSRMAIGILCLSGLSCGVDVGHDSPDDLKKFRCSTEGLCITNDSKKLYSGGYRKGKLEIEFDVAYRPSFVTSLNGGSAYCRRMLWGMEHQYMLCDNSNCPKAWHEGPKKHPSDEAFFTGYMSFLSNFKDFVLAAPAPNGQQTQWEQVQLMAKGSVPREAPDRYGAVGEGIPYPAGAVGDAERLFVYGALSGNSLADSDERKDTELSPSGRSPSFLSSSSSRRKSHDSVVPSVRKIMPGYEFKQTLELWSQPTKSMLIFGWNTRKHHTGSKSYVYFRRLHSKDEWKQLDVIDTGNHGAFPNEENMQHYATCTDTPTTQGWFAYGGECEGGWAIEHLCNDDTAYQIYHAYGNWNGGKHCLGKRRFYRPWCGKPW